MNSYEERHRLMRDYKRIATGVIDSNPGNLDREYMGVFSEMVAYVSRAMGNKRWDNEDFVQRFNEGLLKILEKLDKLGGKENE